MAIELTRFYNDARITITFPKWPPGRMEDWQEFLLDIAKQMEWLAGQNGSDGSPFAPYAIYGEGTPEEIKVQLYFPARPPAPYGHLLTLLLYGMVHIYQQTENTAWQLGVFAVDIKRCASAITEGSLTAELLSDFYKRYDI